MAIAGETLHLGSTYRFVANPAGIQLDGATLDLAGATVYLLMQDPALNITSYVATLTIPTTTGLAAVIGNAAMLYAVGEWKRTWRVVKGSIDLTWLPWLPFEVAA